MSKQDYVQRVTAVSTAVHEHIFLKRLHYSTTYFEKSTGKQSCRNLVLKLTIKGDLYSNFLLLFDLNFHSDRNKHVHRS